MRSLNLDQVRTFLTVAETASFSEAGRRLNLTQSAISQQIKELETRLGVRLLDRLGKKAHATPAGEELRRHGESLLQRADHAVEAVRALRDGGWGRVRLATSATLGAYVLPPILRSLQQEHARLQATVVAGPAREMLRRLAQNEVDLLFSNGPVPADEPSLEVTIACPSSFMAFWPKSIGPAPQAAVTPRDLADKPFIFYTPGNLNHELARNWFMQAGCWPATMMELDSGLSILALIEAGLGVAILPREVAQAPTILDRIEVRRIDPPIPSSLYVAIHRDKPRTEALRTVQARLLATRVDHLIGGNLPDLLRYMGN